MQIFYSHLLPNRYIFFARQSFFKITANSVADIPPAFNVFYISAPGHDAGLPGQAFFNILYP